MVGRYESDGFSYKALALNPFMDYTKLWQQLESSEREKEKFIVQVAYSSQP